MCRIKYTLIYVKMCYCSFILVQLFKNKLPLLKLFFFISDMFNKNDFSQSCCCLECAFHIVLVPFWTSFLCADEV